MGAGREVAVDDWNGGAGIPTPLGFGMPAGGGIEPPGPAAGALTVFLPSRAFKSILGFLSSDILAVSPVFGQRAKVGVGQVGDGPGQYRQRTARARLKFRFQREAVGPVGSSLGSHL